MKKLWNKIVFEYNSIHNSISFWYMKRKANKLHRLTGKRYHVVPSGKHSLMVVDNTYLDFYNRQAKKHRKPTIDIMQLLKMSYYSTSVQSIVRQ